MLFSWNNYEEKFDKERYKPKEWESKVSAGEQYYRLFDSLITSGAYMNLSVYAKTLYTYMLREAHKSKQFFDVGEFGFSISTGLKYLNCSKPKVIMCIEELIESGFIQRTNNSKYAKITSKFCFSDKWKHV